MPEPWDRPPAPTVADDNENITYASVGYALSHWEAIEGELSHLYALFIGKLWENEAYDLYYKHGGTTKNRLKTLETAAARHFQKRPNQHVEGKFSELVRAATGFADRRHEIAHGIVRPVQWYWPFVPETMQPPPDSAFKFCLVPPHYQRNWFANAMPDYIYTSREVILIGNQFHDFLHVILNFRHRHLPDPPRPSPDTRR